MSQFAPSGLTKNVQSGTHSDKSLEGWGKPRGLSRVELAVAVSTNKPRMWIGEGVQKRTDARYGFFYNAGLNRESRTKQLAVED
jgi:hypothetical protein